MSLVMRNILVSLSVEIIYNIAFLCGNILDLSKIAIPNEMIQIAIHTLPSNSVTPEEQALCYFTCPKYKNLLLNLI